MQTLSIFPECSISISTKDDGAIHTYEELSHLHLQEKLEHHVYLPTHGHTTGVWTITKDNAAQLIFPADIVLTHLKHTHIAHQFADCVPLVLIDRSRKTVGFAHLGWRGILTGGVQVAILAMHAEFGSRPQDLWTWIGPCIRKESYLSQVRPAQSDLPAWRDYLTDIQIGETIQWSVDLPGFIKSQCATFGIDPERIIDDGRDTYQESEIFFSHQRWVQRQDPSDKGNFIVAVSLI